MYYIRKYADSWAIHNNQTRKSRMLSQNEVMKILDEFPNLRNGIGSHLATTFFRNKIRSISDLP
ncbi:MAG: hypothetical protein AAF388_07705 [Bacteroidota bacterium]